MKRQCQKVVYKNTLNGYIKSYMQEKKAYELWLKHYEQELQKMYIVFQESCKKNCLKYSELINYNIFCNFIFENSTLYL